MEYYKDQKLWVKENLKPKSKSETKCYGTLPILKSGAAKGTGKCLHQIDGGSVSPVDNSSDAYDVRTFYGLGHNVFLFLFLFFLFLYVF